MNQPGDEMESWVEEYGDYLYRFALSRVQNQEAAEDLVQNTFLAAIIARNSFEGKSEIRVWLTGILKHKIVDHYRTNFRYEPTEDIEELSPRASEDFPEKGMWRESQKAWKLTPEEVLEHTELQKMLWNCVQALPDKIRNLFILREVDGEEAEVICGLLELTASNLYVLLYRARHQLRKCFEEFGILGADHPLLKR